MSKLGLHRSKGERKNTIVHSAATVAAAAATATTLTQDIVYGKFSHHDWLWMLERDESDAFITDIVEEVYKLADKIIYEEYLKRQSIPYTVMQIKDKLLEMVEWQYMAHDEDSSKIDSSLWFQDEEPLASITDCWAQGIVPQTFRQQPTISEEVESVTCETSAWKEQNTRVSDKVDCFSPPPQPSSASPGAGDTCSPVAFKKGEDAADDTCTPVKFEKGEDCATQSEPCDIGSPSGKESPVKLPDPELVCGINELMAANEETRGSEPDDRKPSVAVEASVGDVCQTMFPRDRRSESEDRQPPVTESCISTTGRDDDRVRDY